MNSILFTPNMEKMVEAIVWMANERPNLDFHCALKAMYFADKDHLVKCAKPIFGETYIKMPKGPVGTVAYDILKKNSYLPVDLLEKLDQAFKVDWQGSIPQISPLRQADMMFFSEVECQCLQASLAKAYKLDFGRRTQMSHDLAWEQAELNNPMDYSLIVPQDYEHRDDLIAYLEENSKFMVL